MIDEIVKRIYEEDRNLVQQQMEQKVGAATVESFPSPPLFFVHREWFTMSNLSGADDHAARHGRVYEAARGVAPVRGGGDAPRKRTHPSVNRADACGGQRACGC